VLNSLICSSAAPAEDVYGGKWAISSTKRVPLEALVITPPSLTV
jgi:hypothetical protein